MISREEIARLAGMSMLEFSGEEVEELKVKLEESLRIISRLEEVNTEDVEPLYRVYDYQERLREDQVDSASLLSREEALQNTVEEEYGYFKLLNIMD